MVTYRKNEIMTTGKSLIEISCLSSDTKPTDCANGSIAMEMDTATVFMFDEATKTWRAWS